jgi:hypothetical protein
MSIPRTVFCTFALAALALGCSSGPPPRPELDLEDPPPEGVRAPSWYTPTDVESPWPLGAEPKYGTDQWREWCALRHHPRAVVPPAGTAPRIDGKLDDDAWNGSALKGPMVDTRGAEANPTTTVYATYDAERLYLAARANEPYPNRLVRKADRRDGPLRSDDRIEFALAPDWRDDTFGVYWFRVNSRGALADGLDSNWTWDPAVEVAAAVGEKAWAIELAVPLDALGLKKGEDPWGRVWACRVVRHRYAGASHDVSSWTRLIDPASGRSDWGHVIFKGVKPPEKKPEKPTPEAEKTE